MITIKNIVAVKLITVSLFFCMPVSAANSEFQQWMQQQSQGVAAQKQAFQQYKDERDREFSAFLKAHWKVVDVIKGEVRDEEPKPDVMPVAVSRPEPVKAVESPVIFITPKPVPKKAPVPAIPVAKGRPLTIDFYGRPLRFYFDSSIKVDLSLNSAINKEVISNYWAAISKADYDGLLKQVNEQKRSLQLNDWAYASLINKLALSINNNQRNESALMSWFLLAKSGYKARVAFNTTAVFLLVPSKQEMFEVSYFTFGGIRYYAVELDGRQLQLGQVYTYDGEYPRATKEFDMHVTAVVASNDKDENRHLSFEFEGKKYNIDVAYDRGRVKFFSTYPQLDLPLYFGSGVYEVTATPLQRQLASHMQGMSEQQAVNFLLRFVQTSLQYETDDRQFGRENYLFPEETLFYPYSDCEDRAVLFAWLVRSLLNLRVVGLDYPGHVSAAVRFNEPVTGDSVTYQGGRFVVTDPTYTNANAGMTMPDFKQFTPRIIAY